MPHANDQNYICPNCGEYLHYNRSFQCWQCENVKCGWFTRTEGSLESCWDLRDKEESK